MIEANPRFLQKQAKITLRRGSLSANVTGIKLGPGTYQLFLLRTCMRTTFLLHTPEHTVEIWKNI